MTLTSNRDPEPLTVDITMHEDDVGGNPLMSEERVASLVRLALHEEGMTGSWEIAIRFVDDAEMTRLHGQFMGDFTSTDILTFPYDEDDGVPGGDIVISTDTAGRNADDAGWSPAEELRFLILHGVLHITGWDDDTGTRRKAMLARQHRLLAGWALTNRS